MVLNHEWTRRYTNQSEYQPFPFEFGFLEIHDDANDQVIDSLKIEDLARMSIPNHTKENPSLPAGGKEG